MFRITVETHTSPADEMASALLREATALKQAGKMIRAVEKLREAYVEISKTKTDYGVEVFLRIPLYLQAAGQGDEAWREFNFLLTSGYPNMPKGKWSWHLMESKVYDKMRLVLQREGKSLMAVSFGVRSYIKELRSELQKPNDIKDEKFIEKAYQSESLTTLLEPLLKKAKRLNNLQETVVLLSEWVRALPNTDDMPFEKRLAEIVKA